MKKSSKKTAQRKKDNAYCAYFLATICTRNGDEFFGKMKSGKLEPTKTGTLAREAWESIPQNHEGISLDDYVIMPNHLHGILTCTCGNGEKQFIKALEKSIKIIDEFKKSVAEKALKPGRGKKFGWAKDFNIYSIKDESELYDMRYYIEKESTKWEFDSENSRNKLYIIKGKKK